MSIRLVAASVLLLNLVGCLAPSGEPDGPSPYGPLPDTDAREDIGYFISDFQAKMQLWNKLKLELDPEEDPREFHALERDMKRRARKRMTELVEVLEAGAPINRPTAAVALGFTLYTDAVSPLLAALSDKDDMVAQNAALGLGLLAWPSTNLAPLRYQLLNHPWDGVRSNCAYALLEIGSETRRRELGGQPSGPGNSTAIVEQGPVLTADERLERDRLLSVACAEALRDPNEGVRVQCAALLGLLRDRNAIDALFQLLFDEWNLPATAAATSLVHIAREYPETRGRVARALVDSLPRVENSRASAFRRRLALLSGRNHRDNDEAWREWAYSLP